MVYQQMVTDHQETQIHYKFNSEMQVQRIQRMQVTFKWFNKLKSAWDTEARLVVEVGRRQPGAAG